MTTELPVVVDAAAVGTWSDEVDVLVVGFGVAGGCAAVEAAGAGARVLVLDRAGPESAPVHWPAVTSTSAGDRRTAGDRP